MLYFPNLPFSYPMNPFLYILISLPIINTLLCKVPLTVLIIYLFKLVFHVFDYFVKKKEGATVKEGLSQGATKAYQEVKTTCIDLKDRVCEVGKEFVRSIEAKHYPIEVKESPKEFTMFLDAPGMKKEDFKVNVNADNELVISLEKRSEKEEKEGDKDKKEGHRGTYLRREFSYTSFQQSFSLPDDVDRQKISAKVENGVLTIDLPKKEVTPTAPVSHQIEIK